MNTVMVTTLARLPPARLSTWSICENTCFTCASKLLAMSLPSLSRVAVCPATQTVLPPSVMTPGENARDSWNGVFSMYSAAVATVGSETAKSRRVLKLGAIVFSLGLVERSEQTLAQPALQHKRVQCAPSIRRVLRARRRCAGGCGGGGNEGAAQSHPSRPAGDGGAPRQGLPSESGQPHAAGFSRPGRGADQLAPAAPSARGEPLRVAAPGPGRRAVAREALGGVAYGRRGRRLHTGGVVRAVAGRHRAEARPPRSQHRDRRLSRASALPSEARSHLTTGAPGCISRPRHFLFFSGKKRHGYWHGKVVQRLQGLRLHHSGRRRQGFVRALLRDPGGRIQDPEGEPEGQLRGRSGAEGPAGSEHQAHRVGPPGRKAG